MKYEWTISRERTGKLFLRTSNGKQEGKFRAVCTVQDAVRILGRSRRHVYRYIREGVLNAHGRFLGQWFLDPREVETLAAMPDRLRRPPRRFQPFFPEHPLRSLNPYRDWRIILSRLLDLGGAMESRWVLDRYPLSLIRQFISEDAERRLSPRSLRFWSLYSGAKPRQPTLSSGRGERWGGIA